MTKRIEELNAELREVVADLNRMPESQWGSEKAGRLQERLAKLEDRLARMRA